MPLCHNEKLYNEFLGIEVQHYAEMNPKFQEAFFMCQKLVTKKNIFPGACTSGRKTRRQFTWLWLNKYKVLYPDETSNVVLNKALDWLGFIQTTFLIIKADKGNRHISLLFWRKETFKERMMGWTPRWEGVGWMGRLGLTYIHYWNYVYSR